MKKLNSRDLAYSALGSALITVCSWISIPTEIPFTLQTFAVCLISALLGAKLGTISVIVYILLGTVGIPVFSGFRSGLGTLLGTTGGYIIGFIFTALIVGFIAERFGRKILPLAVSMAAGILVCYAFGTVWFIQVYAKTSGAIGIMTALSWCVFPYLLPDGAKIAVAVPLAIRLHKLLSKG